MKITALTTLLLLTGLAYGQSEQAHLKGKNEIGLNYNSLFGVYNSKFQNPVTYSYLSFGYGRWVTDRSVVGSNVHASINGRNAWQWNANFNWRYYVMSTRHFGLYVKSEIGVHQELWKEDFLGELSQFISTSAYGSLGAGLEYRITPRWIIYGEANYQKWYPKGKIDDFISLSTGVRFRF